jgi:hypothetical protein
MDEFDVSTIAAVLATLLLLLLLQAMDEFDVFMDAINRRIATQTLLEFAREKADSSSSSHHR